MDQAVHNNDCFYWGPPLHTGIFFRKIPFLFQVIDFARPKEDRALALSSLVCLQMGFRPTWLESTTFNPLQYDVDFKPSQKELFFFFENIVGKEENAGK